MESGVHTEMAALDAYLLYTCVWIGVVDFLPFRFYCVCWFLRFWNLENFVSVTCDAHVVCMVLCWVMGTSISIDGSRCNLRQPGCRDSEHPVCVVHRRHWVPCSIRRVCACGLQACTVGACKEGNRWNTYEGSKVLFWSGCALGSALTLYEPEW